MQRLSCKVLAVLLIAPLMAPLLHAQRNRDPLTSQESDKIADLRDRPNDRIKLYQKFLQERIDAIKTIGPNPASEDRKADLQAKYQEFTRISDELQDNLDTFDQAHADIRKSLKDLIPASAKWTAVLNQSSGDGTEDFARKTALESAQSTSDEAKQLYKTQEQYFKEHKDERGKNGSGPS